MRTLAGFAIMLVLASCSGADGTTSETTPGVEGIFFPVAPEPSNVSMAALLHGRLVVHDECVFIDTGAALTLPVWPYGTTLAGSPDGYEIHDAQGRPVASSGTGVDAGGGYAVELGPGRVNPPIEERLRGLEDRLGTEIPE